MDAKKPIKIIISIIIGFIGATLVAASNIIEYIKQKRGDTNE